MHKDKVQGNSKREKRQTIPFKLCSQVQFIFESMHDINCVSVAEVTIFTPLYLQKEFHPKRKFYF